MRVSLRGPATGAPFSPSSSAISLPSTTAEEAYGEHADPSSSGGPLTARGGALQEHPFLFAGIIGSSFSQCILNIFSSSE